MNKTEQLQNITISIAENGWSIEESFMKKAESDKDFGTWSHKKFVFNDWDNVITHIKNANLEKA